MRALVIMEEIVAKLEISKEIKKELTKLLIVGLKDYLVEFITVIVKNLYRILRRNQNCFSYNNKEARITNYSRIRARIFNRRSYQKK